MTIDKPTPNTFVHPYSLTEIIQSQRETLTVDARVSGTTASSPPTSASKERRTFLGVFLGVSYSLSKSILKVSD